MEIKQQELILLFIKHDDLEKSAKVYLNLTNRPKAILDLLAKQNTLDEKKLEELTKTLKAMNQGQHKNDAISLATKTGDYFFDNFVKAEKSDGTTKEALNKYLSTAGAFYKLGFSWDNTSEECYTKLSKVLSK